MTGLPPTPEEVDAFLKDDSAEAFAKVVDRLLAAAAEPDGSVAVHAIPVGVAGLGDRQALASHHVGSNGG